MGNVAAQYCLLSEWWNIHNIPTKTKPVCIPVYIGLGGYRTSSSLPSTSFYLLIYGVYLMVEYENAGLLFLGSIPRVFL